MEKLWEKFIHRVLAEYCTEPWSVAGQEQEPFWEDRTMRPDLVFTHQGIVGLIGDTKWEVPTDDEPSMDDLRQMFAYNIRFVSERSVLFYPGKTRVRTGRYVNHVKGWHATDHGCEVRFMMPFDERGALDAARMRNLAQELMG